MLVTTAVVEVVEVVAMGAKAGVEVVVAVVAAASVVIAAGVSVLRALGGGRTLALSLRVMWRCGGGGGEGPSLRTLCDSIAKT